MGGTPGTAGSGPAMVQETVVSVGPYALNMRRPVAHLATREACAASPAMTRFSTAGRLPSGSWARTAGGRVACVTPNSPIRDGSWSAWSSMSAGPSTRQAPALSGVQISETAASKLSEANCSARLPGPMPYAPILASTMFGMERCSTTTPLGRPVEPDV